MSAAGCGHPSGDPGDHTVLADELRRYVFGALELVEPYIEQVRDAPSTPTTDGSTAGPACDTCPVCAVITVMRGERSELAARLAEQATGLVAVLRAALAEGLGASSAGFPAAADPAPDEPRGVQRIHVVREDGTASRGAC